jgi:hypothetical protein
MFFRKEKKEKKENEIMTNAVFGDLEFIDCAWEGDSVSSLFGEEKTINIPVPTKTSQLLNDSNFVDTSALIGLEDRVTEDVLNALGDDVLTKDIVMDEFTIDDIDKDDKIPSVGAVVKYIEECVVDSSTIQQIIDGAVNRSIQQSIT